LTTSSSRAATTPLKLKSSNGSKKSVWQTSDVGHQAHSDYGAVNGVRDTTFKVQRGNGWGSSPLEIDCDQVGTIEAVDRRRCTGIQRPCLAQCNQKRAASHIEVVTVTVVAENFYRHDLGTLRDTTNSERRGSASKWEMERRAERRRGMFARKQQS
jgi:hypothetical protein